MIIQVMSPLLPSECVGVSQDGGVLVNLFSWMLSFANIWEIHCQW